MNKNAKEEKLHTISTKYLGQGKGKRKIETYYYGEAILHIKPSTDLSRIKFTKGDSLEEILADFTWKARLKKLFHTLYRPSC